MTTFKIISSDVVAFKVDVKVAGLSKTMTSMLSGVPESKKIIKLTNVNSVVLELVLSWMKFHEANPPLASGDDDRAKRQEQISKWDEEFLENLDPGTLFEIILAADYLDITGLLELTGNSVAKLVVGKKPEEIRQTFGIQGDFTAEEEKQIQKENDWCEEK